MSGLSKAYTEKIKNRNVAKQLQIKSWHKDVLRITSGSKPFCLSGQTLGKEVAFTTILSASGNSKFDERGKVASEDWILF